MTALKEIRRRDDLHQLAGQRVEVCRGAASARNPRRESCLLRSHPLTPSPRHIADMT